MMDEKEMHEDLDGLCSSHDLVIGYYLPAAYSVEHTKERKSDALELAQRRI
jgi:urocanate hydratase